MTTYILKKLKVCQGVENVYLICGKTKSKTKNFKMLLKVDATLKSKILRGFVMGLLNVNSLKSFEKFSG